MECVLEEPRILSLRFQDMYLEKIAMLKKYGFSEKEIAEFIRFHSTAFVK